MKKLPLKLFIATILASFAISFIGVSSSQVLAAECSLTSNGECTYLDSDCYVAGKYRACKSIKIPEAKETCYVAELFTSTDAEKDRQDDASINKFCSGATRSNVSPLDQEKTLNENRVDIVSGKKPTKTPEYGECNYFLGMVSWDCHVKKIENESALKSGIWTIVSNIASDITIIASYLVIAYVIYGGYLYTFSRGEPAKVAEGKKTLTQAFIGLGIVLSASVIVNTIRLALGVNLAKDCTQAGKCINDANTMVVNYINWVIGIAGVMSLIFVVYGGALYITSTGDPGKVKQAKNMIMYSLIGLAIVALAATITAFVSQSIREANENALIKTTLISKEVHEIKNS